MEEQLIINTKIDIDYANAEKQLKDLNKRIDKAVKDREIKIKLSDDLKKDGAEKSVDGKTMLELSEDLNKVGEDLLKSITDLTTEIQNLMKEATEISKNLVGHVTVGADEEATNYLKGIHDNLIKLTEKILSEGSIRNTEEKSGFSIFGFLRRHKEKKQEKKQEKPDKTWSEDVGLGNQTGAKTASMMENITSKLKGFGSKFKETWDKIKESIKDESGAISMAPVSDAWDAIKPGVENTAQETKRTLSGVWDKVKNIFSVPKRIAESFRNVTGGIRRGIGNLVNNVSSVFTKVGNGFNRGAKLLATPMRGLQKIFMNLRAHFTKPVGMLNQSLGGLLRRLAGFAGLTAIVGKFVSYLQQVLRRNAEFRQAMADLKGALYTLAQPLIEFIVPAVIKAVRVLTILVRTLAAIVSKAFGKSLEEMARNAESTYNDIQSIYKTIADYDELNVINRDDTIYPDFSHVGEDILPWQDPIALGKLLADRINQAIESIDWEEIGRNIGYWFDYAVKFAWSLLHNINFDRLGLHLAEMINAALEQVDFWYLGALVVRWFTILPELIIGFLEELDWGLVARSLSDFIKGALDEAIWWLDKYDWDALNRKFKEKFLQFWANMDFDDIIKKFTDFATKLGAAIGNLIDVLVFFVDHTLWNFDFAAVGEALAKGFNEMLSKIDFEQLGHAVAGFLNIFDTFIGFLEETNWEQIGQKISDFFIGLFDGITQWFNEHEWKELGEGLYEDINDLADGLDSGGIIGSFTTMMGTIFTALGEFILGALGEIWEKVKGWWESEIVGNTWAETASNLLNSILRAFGDIKKWVMDHIVNPFMNALVGEEEWDNLKKRINEKLDNIAKIGAPLSLVAGLVLLLTGHFLLGMGLLLFGVDLLQRKEGGTDFTKLFSTIKEHVGDIIAGIIGIAFVAGFVLLLTGNPLGLGLIIAGIAAVKKFKELRLNWDWLKEKLKGVVGNIILGLAGLLFVMGAVLLITGNPLGIGLILAGVAGVGETFSKGLNWDWLKLKLQGEIGDIVKKVSYFFIIIGLIALMIHKPLEGIGLMVVGLSGLTVTGVSRLDGVQTLLRDKIGKVMDLGGDAMVAIGAALLLVPGAQGFALALISAGMAIGITGVAKQANFGNTNDLTAGLAGKKNDFTNLFTAVQQVSKETAEQVKADAQSIAENTQSSLITTTNNVSENILSNTGIVVSGLGTISEEFANQFTGEGGVEDTVEKSKIRIKRKVLAEDGIKQNLNSMADGTAKSTADELDATEDNLDTFADNLLLRLVGSTNENGTGGVKGVLNSFADGMSDNAYDEFADSEEYANALFEGLNIDVTGSTDGKGHSGTRALLTTMFDDMPSGAAKAFGTDNRSGVWGLSYNASENIRKMWRGQNGRGGLKLDLDETFNDMDSMARTNLSATDYDFFKTTESIRGNWNVMRDDMYALYPGMAKKSEALSNTGKGSVIGHFSGMSASALTEIAKIDKYTEKLMSNMKTTIGNGLNTDKDSVLSKFTTFSSNVSLSFSTVTGGIVLTFNKMRDQVASVAESIRVTMVNCFNAIAIGFRGPFNTIISWLNQFIDQMNNRVTQLGTMVQGMGKSLNHNVGWSVPPINRYTVAAMAKGGVVPPNREFLALLGDNKKETEVVSPLSTIRQAVEEAMAGMNTGNNQPIILQLDGKVIAQVVWDEQNKQYKQYGKYVPRYQS